MKEMIEVFVIESYILNSVIKFQIIMLNGEMEVVEDVGGVIRDVLIEFWILFYIECIFGNVKKVLCLRYDFGEEQWRVVVKIIIFGWKIVSYFLV